VGGQSDKKKGNILSADMFQYLSGELKSDYNNLGSRTTIQDNDSNVSS
jgi:hypothetical protein